jgi:threonyl-tRNA synthetase
MSPSNNKLDILRHSTSHLMAAAVQKLWPHAKFGIGPVIENGFYYDIQTPNYSLKEDDLKKIEHEMHNLIKQNIKFDRKEISLTEAVKLFKKLKQDYKIELLKDIKEKGTTKIEGAETEVQPGGKVSIYTTGNFVDLCRGPHVKSTHELSGVAFKLERLAGAYWRGSEKNPMLTRIYGIAFESPNELKKYLKLLAEAEKRDHRKLGQELDLFMIDEEVGQGLILWLPKGALLRQVMEKFVMSEYQKRGYQLVMSPHIASAKLFEQSGHLGFYKDSMYSPMDIEGSDYYIKPMNCPFHIKMYKRDIKSYRDLPIRYTELGTVYRYERSGTLHGLTRVRGFTQDDAHIICTREQLTDELVGVIELTKYILQSFGFDKFKVVLSIRDFKNKDKYLGQDRDWQLAESGLKKALEKSGWSYEVEEGEAVFYGPKIDVKVFDAVGREWQISTLQLDFNEPERFNITYIEKNGREKQAFMLHRALLGSLERFTGVLIEHYAGAFPLWLSPTQIVIITVGSAHRKYAHQLAEQFKQQNFRIEVWDENETVGNKIRKSIAQKIPYMLVIGDKEIKSKHLHVRQRGSDKVEKIDKDKFIEHIQKLIQQKSLKL